MRRSAVMCRAGTSCSARRERLPRSRRLATAFEARFGFPARVIVVQAGRWEEATLLKKTAGRESFQISNDAIYLHAPDGFGTSKFAAGMERAVGVPMTVRNWRTTAALHEMVKETA